MTQISAAWKVVLSAALLAASSVPSLTRSFTAKADTHKAQISIEQSYVKIALSLDPKLNSFAELFQNCFAEGKAWAHQKNNDAAAEWRDNRKAFRGLQWFYDRDYALRSVVGRYVSVVRSDDWFDGGAHPNHHADTILWDNGAHKRTNIRAFFNETADNGLTMVNAGATCQARGRVSQAGERH